MATVRHEQTLKTRNFVTVVQALSTTFFSKITSYKGKQRRLHVKKLNLKSVVKALMMNSAGE